MNFRKIANTVIAVLGLVLAGRLTAQTFTTLYSFTAGSGTYSWVTNSDGAAPHGVISSGNILYGTAGGGGSAGQGHGTVFAVNTEGTAFTTLHSFTGGDDGALPDAGLILSRNTLYGTTWYGGSGGRGTVFAVNTDGTAFTNLHSFAATYPTNSDGAYPQAGLILSGNILYGTASHGGSGGYGTVFSIILPGPPQLTIASDGSGGYFIRVQGTPGVTYRLQRAHDLTGPWDTSAPQTAPASGLVEFWDLFPPSDRAFYRAVQQ